MTIKNALLLYPSQFYCPDPATPPIVIKTQFLKFLQYFHDQEVRAEFVDLELEFGRPATEFECEQFLTLTRSRIGGSDFDFIGISCYTSMSYLSTLAVSKLARELYPNAIIAVGGYHTLGKPEDFLGQKQIDFIVRGSGVRFLHALQNSLAVDRVCTFTGLSDSLKETLYEQYPYRSQGGELGVAHLQLSQGCPFQCDFCCEPFIGNSKYEPLDVDTALSEIDRAVNALSARKVVIEDVIFGFNANWRYDFLTRLRERRYEQVFWLEMRVDTLTERTFALLADMNVYLTVGLEALSPATLKYMNKTSNPERYLRAFYETVELANRFDVPITYSIILNYPGETWRSYNETMDAIDSTITSERSQAHRFDFYEYQFFPGNTVFQSINKLGNQFGCEVWDPEWYKRKTGDMLEKARCRAPSKDLIDHVGEEGIHSYYRDRVKQVEERCQPTNRGFLLRNWRFVERLRSRYPSAGWDRVYSLSNVAAVHGMQQQLVRLAQLHQVLTNDRVLRSERGGALSWWARNSIWEDAFEAVCSLTEDPLQLNSEMQSRVTRQVHELIAEPGNSLETALQNPLTESGAFV